MHVLVIDDDPQYRRLLRHHLTTAWPDARVTALSSGPNVPATPEGSGGVDIVLAAAERSGGDVLEWLRQWRSASAPPVIVLAAQGDEFLAVRAIKAGAWDYLPKDRLRHDLLVESVRGALSQRHDTAAAAEAAARRIFRGYELLRELSADEHWRICLVRNPETGEQRVFKVVRPLEADSVNQDRALQRFLHEYEAVARVRHPNVVQIFELGVADDQAYIEMEYLPAGDLRQAMARGIEPREALELLAQCASALAAIHREGVLHRDLKPANILFRDESTPVLIDFGLARELRAQGSTAGHRKISGTPHYMSPEQGHGQSVDARSDIYSLGIIGYEMLTGNRPFDAADPMALIFRHRNEPRPRLPGRLEYLQPLLDRMWAPLPEDRFGSAEELERVLRTEYLP